MEQKVIASSGNVEVYSDGKIVAYFDKALEATDKESAVIVKVMDKGRPPVFVAKESMSKLLDDDAHEAATGPYNLRPQPTERQRSAGNYKKGHVKVGGLDISIENPVYSRRRPKWPAMSAHYGYIRGTKGKDKDHVDVFVKPGTDEKYAGPAFVVDQTTATGEFDEHKVLLGYLTLSEARRAYLAHYGNGWKVGPITEMTMEQLKDWLFNGDTTKPLKLGKINLAGLLRKPDLN